MSDDNSDQLGLSDLLNGAAARALQPAAGRSPLARLLGDTLPCSGALQLACDGCGEARTVSFRCAGTCVACPRDADRRARALVRMIPRVPVRHWVLSVPEWIRPHLATDDVLTARVTKIFMDEIFRVVRLSAERPGQVHCGAVSLVHRGDRALDLRVHIHVMALDGVYDLEPGRVGAVFHPLKKAPSRERLDGMSRRLARALREAVYQRAEASDPRPGPTRGGGLRVSESTRAGPPARASVRRVRVISEEAPRRPAPPDVGLAGRCGDLEVHRGSRVRASERDVVLRLSRYLVRPPVDASAFESGAGGRIRYRLREPFADGTTHVEFEPEQLAQKLGALVEGGASHRVGYHGVLAPAAAARWRVMPTQLALVDSQRATPGRTQASPKLPEVAPQNAATGAGLEALLKCDNCEQPMRIAAVEERIDDPA